MVSAGAGHRRLAAGCTGPRVSPAPPKRRKLAAWVREGMEAASEKLYTGKAKVPGSRLLPLQVVHCGLQTTSADRSPGRPGYWIQRTQIQSLATSPVGSRAPQQPPSAAESPRPLALSNSYRPGASAPGGSRAAPGLTRLCPVRIQPCCGSNSPRRMLAAEPPRGSGLSAPPGVSSSGAGCANPCASRRGQAGDPLVPGGPAPQGAW